VFTSENLISCFFDDKLIFISRAEYANEGRIGLYSVDSKASFEELRVFSSVPELAKPEHTLQNGFISFWFSDYFNTSSGMWYKYRNKSDNPFPWQISDAGMGITEKDSNRYVSEFIPYDLTNFMLSVMISLDRGNDDAYMEVFFRKQSEDTYYAIRFSKKERKAELIQVSKKISTVLKQGSLPSNIFNNTFALYIEINNNRVICRTTRSTILDVRDKNLHTTGGTFGFAAYNVNMVLHEINVAMVSKDEEKSQQEKKGKK